MRLTTKVKGSIASTFVIASVLFGQPTFAQVGETGQQIQQQSEAFSDAELQQFLNASEKATEVQQKSQEEMVATVEQENLTLEKFNQMAEALQQQKLAEVGATPEEMAAFNKAGQRIMEMKSKVQEEMVQAIEGEGLSVDKFEKIMQAYQQNPEVQAKVNKLVQEKQK